MGVGYAKSTIQKFQKKNKARSIIVMMGQPTEVELAFYKAKLKYEETHKWEEDYKDKPLYNRPEKPAKTYSYKGKMLTMSELSNIANVASNTIQSRLYLGWSIERASETPLRVEKNFSFNGECRTISQWSKITGLGFEVIYNRLVVSQWSVEKALTTPKMKRRPKKGLSNVK